MSGPMDEVFHQDIVCSICIANYNGANVLAACLDSVFQQAFPYPFEVIVHDDASTDGSADIITQKYPAVRLLQSPTNVGFCVSNNRMAVVARGRFLLLLNNDAELHRDALATLYNVAVRQNVYGILGLPQYSMATGELIDRGSLLDPFCNPIPNLNQSRRDVGMIIGACLWLPRRLWEELGGFPEWFESLAEDMYLCCYARVKGYPVIASNIQGIRDAVIDGQTGYLAQESNPDDLIAKIMSADLDRASIRMIVKENFDWPKIAQRYFDVLLSGEAHSSGHGKNGL